MRSLGGKYMLPDGLRLAMVGLAKSAISSMKRSMAHWGHSKGGNACLTH